MTEVLGAADREKMLARIERLQSDFPYFAQNCLKVKPKAGGLVPLKLNAVQLAVHERLEAQLRDTGKGRALILKARQPGVSTYVEGRFFWRVTSKPGTSSFILTHTGQATANLFDMTHRFYEHLPLPLQPHLGASNAKELSFDQLDSNISVATAGAAGAGRAQTIQFLHGSEVAHWPNAQEHAAGVLQAVPSAPGTEVVLESTAAGIGGLFYDMCKAAERGDGEYILIFIPWFWHEEYQAAVPESWEPPEGFHGYIVAHDLSKEQAFWAWQKNSELAQACGASPDEPCWLFRQEYPATGDEAFQAAGAESFIKGELVVKARQWTAPDQMKFPLILGVDIARGGGDKTRIIDRRGRCAGHLINRTINSADLMEVAGLVAAEIDRHHPDAVFIDGTGLGAGVYDRLRERHYREVHLVNFGSKAQDDRQFANKRAEMWGRMQEWLSDPGGADIVDSNEWQSHLCGPGIKFNSNSQMLLESKEDIRARLRFSPDAGDALALTFAESVRRKADMRHLPTRANSRYSPFHWRAHA